MGYRSDSLSRRVASPLPPPSNSPSKERALPYDLITKSPELAWEWNQVSLQTRQCSLPTLILGSNIKSPTRSRVTMPLGLQRTNSCVDIDFTLRRKFKRTAFRYWNFQFQVWYKKANDLHRPLQRDVIVAALAGDDVFVQAATGFGKSLCFQLPAVIDHGSKLLLETLFWMEYLTSSSYYCRISASGFDGMVAIWMQW